MTEISRVELETAKAALKSLFDGLVFVNKDAKIFRMLGREKKASVNEFWNEISRETEIGLKLIEIYLLREKAKKVGNTGKVNFGTPVRTEPLEIREEQDI